ncbi:MAG: hypothetical protein HY721_09540 [Planctomycetes bacterium]|nr:hypothetical protein [Planctomycetota bacterium]
MTTKKSSGSGGGTSVADFLLLLTIAFISIGFLATVLAPKGEALAALEARAAGEHRSLAARLKSARDVEREWARLLAALRRRMPGESEAAGDEQVVEKARREREEVESALADLRRGREAALADVDALRARCRDFDARSAEAARLETDLEERTEQASRLEDEKRLLAGVEAELRATASRVAAERAQAESLRHELARLEDRLEALADLEKRVGSLRMSREEREELIAKLRKETEGLEGQVAAVRRERDDLQKIPARDLVRGGTTKAPLFVECDGKGAWAMPARQLFEKAAPADAKEAFLKAARERGYVLFLVRPDGFKAFDRYREILEEHNARSRALVDLGYEPVDAAWQLAYPGA